MGYFDILMESNFRATAGFDSRAVLARATFMAAAHDPNAQLALRTSSDTVQLISDKRKYSLHAPRGNNRAILLTPEGSLVSLAAGGQDRLFESLSRTGMKPIARKAASLNHLGILSRSDLELSLQTNNKTLRAYAPRVGVEIFTLVDLQSDGNKLTALLAAIVKHPKSKVYLEYLQKLGLSLHMIANHMPEPKPSSLIYPSPER